MSKKKTKRKPIEKKEENIVVTTLPKPRPESTAEEQLKTFKKQAKAWLTSKPHLPYPEEVRLQGWLKDGERLFK